MATSAKLRSLLTPTSPLLAMSSHSPLSALLAAQSGFPAIWLSGFELSALHCVPDASILPFSTILSATRSICATIPDTPVIVDMDTGFGNAVNVAYLVPQFAAAGAAGVVLEDKTFPKDSSLRPGGRQVCVDVEEMVGKIRAATMEGSGMVVVARTEALIAGLGEDEAVRKGEAYVDAGADAVLVHSKERTPDEVLGFVRRWEGRRPLVLVPTAYPELMFEEIKGLGKVGLVICGNHAVRAAVQGMRNAFERILADGGIAGVEGEIATVADIFELQGDEHMRKLEKEYLR